MTYIFDEKYLTEYLFVSYRVYQLHAQYAIKVIIKNSIALNYLYQG